MPGTGRHGCADSRAAADAVAQAVARLADEKNLLGKTAQEIFTFGPVGPLPRQWRSLERGLETAAIKAARQAPAAAAINIDLTGSSRT